MRFNRKKGWKWKWNVLRFRAVGSIWYFFLDFFHFCSIIFLRLEDFWGIIHKSYPCLRQIIDMQNFYNYHLYSTFRLSSLQRQTLVRVTVTQIPIAFNSYISNMSHNIYQKTTPYANNRRILYSFDLNRNENSWKIWERW